MTDKTGPAHKPFESQLTWHSEQMLLKKKHHQKQLHTLQLHSEGWGKALMLPRAVRTIFHFFWGFRCDSISQCCQRGSGEGLLPTLWRDVDRAFLLSHWSSKKVLCHRKEKHKESKHRALESTGCKQHCYKRVPQKQPHFIKVMNPKECFKEEEITVNAALKFSAHIF